MTNVINYNRGINIISSTLGALSAALQRWDARIVLLGSAVVYFIVYLFATGALALSGENGVSLVVVENPLRRMFQPMGYLSFEPIAQIEAVGLTYLFSPLDAIIAGVLAVLIGANLAVTYLGIIQPQTCGLRSSSGVLAAIPALFSGIACCGPVILLVFGIQATGILITGFQLLVPVALVLLVMSLLAVGRQVDPTLL
jgi:hypothetical protein